MGKSSNSRRKLVDSGRAIKKPAIISTVVIVFIAIGVMVSVLLNRTVQKYPQASAANSRVSASEPSKTPIAQQTPNQNLKKTELNEGSRANPKVTVAPQPDPSVSVQPRPVVPQSDTNAPQPDPGLRQPDPSVSVQSSPDAPQSDPASGCSQYQGAFKNADGRMAIISRNCSVNADGYAGHIDSFNRGITGVSGTVQGALKLGMEPKNGHPVVYVLLPKGVAAGYPGEDTSHARLVNVSTKPISDMSYQDYQKTVYILP